MFSQIAYTGRIAAVSLLAAAVLAPAASALRYVPGTPTAGLDSPMTTCHQYCGTAQNAPRVKAPASRVIVRTELVRSGGFDWADAAVGFGTAVACGAALLGVRAAGSALHTRVRSAGRAS